MQTNAKCDFSGSWIPLTYTLNELESDMNAPVTHVPITDNTDSNISVSLLKEPLRSQDSDIPLIQLLGAIGQYHNLRDLSHQERFGTHDSSSRRAISELRALESLLRDAGDDFVVDAKLSIELMPKSL